MKKETSKSSFELQLQDWKLHPFTQLLFDYMRSKHSLLISSRGVKLTSQTPSFEYNLGFDDGALVTLYGLLNLETWFYNEFLAPSEWEIQQQEGDE